MDDLHGIMEGLGRARSLVGEAHQTILNAPREKDDADYETMKILEYVFAMLSPSASDAHDQREALEREHEHHWVPIADYPLPDQTATHRCLSCGEAVYRPEVEA